MANKPYNYSKHIFIDHLLETKHAPLAREKRRTWWQKVKDCYHAIAGQNIFYFFGKKPTKKVHVGAFDYATAYLQIGLLKLTKKLDEKWDNLAERGNAVDENDPNRRKIAGILLLEMFAIGLPWIGVGAVMSLLHIIRTSIAATLTLVFLPIVTAVDFVSKIFLIPDWWAIRGALKKEHLMDCNSYSALQGFLEKHKNLQLTIEEATAAQNNTDSYTIKCQKNQNVIHVNRRCAQAFFNLNLGHIQDAASDEIRASVFPS